MAQQCTVTSISKTAARLPGFMKPGQSRREIAAQRSGSRAIDRFSRAENATAAPRSATSLLMPRSRPEPVAGPAQGWSATMNFAAWSSAASKVVGRLSRSPAGSASKRRQPPSAMRAFTASSTPRSAAPRTMPRGTTCRAPSSKRGCRGRKGGSPAQFIKDRVPIQENARSTSTLVAKAGHWENRLPAVLPLRPVGAGCPGTCLAICPARQTTPSRKAEPTAAQLHDWLSRFATPELRRSLTQDNGTEFANHYELRDVLGINTYFCNPHSPCGKRAASRTPTDGFAASLPAQKPTCANVPFDRYNSSPAAIMPRRGSAWDTKPPPSCSPFTCCTSECESTLSAFAGMTW